MNTCEQQAFSKWSDWPRWIQILVIIAAINFVAYIIINLRIGGDAWNGYKKDGLFYLGSHGRYTEVPENLWVYSYFHTIALWTTHASVFIAAAILLSTKRSKGIGKV